MLELTIEANVQNLDQVLGFVDGQLESLGCSMKVQMQIDVAVEELFVNIASYAYAPGTGSATIQIETERDPVSMPDPDVTLSAEERQIGGLGIYMVKKSMDGMRYRYENGRNILTIRKILTA